MDLTIDYECPDCHKVHCRKLIELAPGFRRECEECGASFILTEVGLKSLQTRLEEFFHT